MNWFSARRKSESTNKRKRRRVKTTTLKRAWDVRLGIERLECRQLLAIDLVTSAPPSYTGNAASTGASLTADGRYLVFASEASNLVDNDTNGVADIFLKDLQTGAISLVSVNSYGVQGSQPSYDPVVSANGRYVAFATESRNLFNDNVFTAQVYVKDLQTGEFTRVSTTVAGVAADGVYNQEPSISSDGRYVAFVSSANNLDGVSSNFKRHVFLKDTLTGSITRISQNMAGQPANDSSYYPVVSDDGSSVSFLSMASNLTAGDGASTPDVFIKNVATGATTQIITGAFVPLDIAQDFRHAMTGDGRYIAFPRREYLWVGDDKLQVRNVYVLDTQTGIEERVSDDSSGAVVDGNASLPTLSSNGRYVAFTSTAALVESDTNGVADVYLKDRLTGVTSRVSVSSTEGQGTLLSTQPAISRNGSVVAFQSLAGQFTVHEPTPRSTSL